MSNCRCYNPPFNYLDYIDTPVGIDLPRYGEVKISTCKLCGTMWLHYFVEYEAFTASGRWFRGLLLKMDVAKITPGNAIAYLEALPWYFAGGCYFDSTGFRTHGKIRADL